MHSVGDGDWEMTDGRRQMIRGGLVVILVLLGVTGRRRGAGE